MAQQSKLARRLIYIVVSVFGIGYEFLLNDGIRWPLVFGYSLIIALTLYVLLFHGDQQADHKEASTD